MKLLPEKEDGAVSYTHLDVYKRQHVKYEGYIKRQERQVEQFKKMEEKKIPADINYAEIPSLRIEAKQKLEELRPDSIGQASRISGVSPADISVLLVYLKANRCV